MKKKVLLCALACALLLTAGVISVSAAAPRGNGCLDADGDGICDYRADGVTPPQEGTARGRGNGNGARPAEEGEQITGGGG